MEIDQSWKHRISRPVDRGGAIRSTPRCNAGDLPIDDSDALTGQDLAARRVDQAAGVDIDRVGCGRAREQQCASRDPFWEKLADCPLPARAS
jgi:hypothetical protein